MKEDTFLVSDKFIYLELEFDNFETFIQWIKQMITSGEIIGKTFYKLNDENIVTNVSNPLKDLSLLFSENSNLLDFTQNKNNKT